MLERYKRVLGYLPLGEEEEDNIERFWQWQQRQQCNLNEYLQRWQEDIIIKGYEEDIIINNDCEENVIINDDHEENIIIMDDREQNILNNHEENIIIDNHDANIIIKPEIEDDESESDRDEEDKEQEAEQEALVRHALALDIIWTATANNWPAHNGEGNIKIEKRIS